MSPGNIKGSVFQNTVKYIRSRKEEGRAQVPDHLQHYLQGRILATAWLPEDDHLELMEVSTRLFVGPGAPASLAAFEETARLTASIAFEGVYRPMAHRSDPGRSLTGFKSFWKLRHDTGDVEVETVSSTEALVRLSDYGVVSEKMCASIKGTLVGLLEHVGATGIEAVHQRCTSKGDDVCEWRLSWQNPG